MSWATGGSGSASNMDQVWAALASDETIPAAGDPLPAWDACLERCPATDDCVDYEMRPLYEPARLPPEEEWTPVSGSLQTCNGAEPKCQFERQLWYTWKEGVGPAPGDLGCPACRIEPTPELVIVDYLDPQQRPNLFVGGIFLVVQTPNNPNGTWTQMGSGNGHSFDSFPQTGFQVPGISGLMVPGNTLSVATEIQGYQMHQWSTLYP